MSPLRCMLVSGWLGATGCAMVTGPSAEVKARPDVAWAPSPQELAVKPLRVRAWSASDGTRAMRDVFAAPLFAYSENTQPFPTETLCEHVQDDVDVLVQFRNTTLPSLRSQVCVAGKRRLVWTRSVRGSSEGIGTLQHLMPWDLKVVCDSYEQDPRPWEIPKVETAQVEIATRAGCRDAKGSHVLRGTRETVFEELAQLFPSTYVEAESRSGAVIRFPIGQEPEEGAAVQTLPPSGRDRGGVITSRTGTMAVVRFLSDREPNPVPQLATVAKNTVGAYELAPEFRMTLSGVSSAGVVLGNIPMHHGFIVGGDFRGVFVASQHGGGADVFVGHLSWLSPTRIAAYFKGEAGFGSVRQDGYSRGSFAHVTPSLGMKWRVPDVAFFDASLGYALGPAANLDPDDRTRPPVSFAWSGPVARLTASFELRVWPGR